jgi:hypothetical protein
VTIYNYVVTRLWYIFGVLKEFKYNILEHKLATYIVYCLVTHDLKHLVECGTIDQLLNPSCWRDTQIMVCLCVCVVAHSKYTILIDGFRDGRYELKSLNDIGSIQNYLISKTLGYEVVYIQITLKRFNTKESCPYIIWLFWLSHTPWDVIIMYHARAFSWILFLKLYASQ